MAKASKEEIKKQKENLNRDLKIFREEVIKRIAETDLKHDEFRSLYTSGNLYNLAIDTTPHLKEKWEKFKQKHPEKRSEISHLIDSVTELIELTLQENDISMESSQVGRDDYLLDVLVGGEKIYSERHYNPIITRPEDFSACLDRIKNKMKELTQYSNVEEYAKLQAELAGVKGPFAGIRKKVIEKKMEKLAKYRVVDDYIKIKTHFDKIQKAIDELRKNQEIKETLKIIHELNEDLTNESNTLSDELSKKANIVLAMKYLNLYNANFDTLKMSPVGAQKQLEDLVTENTEYYSKRLLLRVSKDLDKWIKVGEIASALHEDWREDRKNKEGIYEPRWKKVSDASFIKKVKAMEELPENIRIVDGVVEQDIANTTFNDLCIDYQLENFEAAAFVYQLATTKHYTKAETGIIGKMIHNEWLRRNPWAKGSNLDVEFKDLPPEEQVKDLIQYDIALEIANQEKTAKKENLIDKGKQRKL